MFHNALAAVAAVAITFGTVAELNAQPPKAEYKVTVDKAGRYCIETEAVTGSRLNQAECRTAEQWAADGVKFASPQKTPPQK